jgi:hypothetical protein
MERVAMARRDITASCGWGQRLQRVCHRGERPS